LRLERGPQPWKIFLERRILAGPEITRVLGNALADFESEVQAGKTGVTLLKAFHNAHCVQVVVEARAEALHLAVQSLLAGVREGGMTNIVG
jgi:hypothetical protein